MNALQTSSLTGVACYLLRNGDQEICLAKKSSTEKTRKRHLADKRMPYGGDRQDSDRSPADTTVREVWEESRVRIDPDRLRQFAEILFVRPDGTYLCRYYFSSVWTGEPRSTEEMVDPKWYARNDPPYHQMTHADRLILPVALAMRKVKGTITYDSNGNLVGAPDVKYVMAFDR